MKVSGFIVYAVMFLMLAAVNYAMVMMGMDMKRWRDRLWPTYFVVPLVLDVLFLSLWLAAHGE